MANFVIEATDFIYLFIFYNDGGSDLSNFSTQFHFLYSSLTFVVVSHESFEWAGIRGPLGGM